MLFLCPSRLPFLAVIILRLVWPCYFVLGFTRPGTTQRYLMTLRSHHEAHTIAVALTGLAKMTLLVIFFVNNFACLLLEDRQEVATDLQHSSILPKHPISSRTSQASKATAAVATLWKITGDMNYWPTSLPSSTISRTGPNLVQWSQRCWAVGKPMY